MDALAGAMPVQERAKQTRVRLLDAAVQCLAEVGYAATTTALIQQKSGVSRGSLLHQFPSRDALLVAAVHHLAAARTTDLMVSPPDRGGGDDIDSAVETLWATLHGPLFAATVEMWVASRTRPELREALQPEEHRLGAQIRAVVEVVFGPRYSDHPHLRELGTLLWSSMRGVAMTYTFEPRDPSREPSLAAWKRMARLFLAS